MTPLRALGRGLLAGLAGTAAMTAYQEVVAKTEGSGDGGDSKESSWENAPAPAQVARRILKGVFGRDVPPERIPLVTNIVHWGYGTGWGGLYGLIQGSVRAETLPSGVLLGASVWALSYAQLVPMGLYEPPWEYPAKTVAKDLSYHLVYGLGVATVFSELD